jgi:hypothetical protein
MASVLVMSFSRPQVLRMIAVAVAEAATMSL